MSVEEEDSNRKLSSDALSSQQQQQQQQQQQSSYSAENEKKVSHLSTGSEIDGQEFLDHLRGVLVGVVGGEDELHDTVRARNTSSSEKQHSKKDSIFELFPHLKEESSEAETPAAAAPSAAAPASAPANIQAPEEEVEEKDRQDAHSYSYSHSYPSSMPSKPSTIHNRGVSWGKNSDYEHNASLDGGSTISSERQHRRPRGISIGDVAGPFEAEAETAILRAMEEQSAYSNQNRARADTFSSLLSQVPDTAVHDFDITSPKQNTPDKGPAGSDQAAATTGNITIEEPDNQSENSPQRHRTASTEQSRPFIKGHRRGLSVEETLTGLTLAFTEHFDDDEASRHSSSHPKRSRAGSGGGDDSSSHPNHHKMERRPTLERIYGWHSLAAIQESSEHHATNKNKPQMSGSTPSESTSDPRVGVDLEAQDADGGGGGGGNDDDDNTNDNGRQSSRDDSTPSELHKHNKRNRYLGTTNDAVKENIEFWNQFFRPRKRHVFSYAKTVLLFLLLPLTGIATILFYFADNPPTGTTDNPSNEDNNPAEDPPNNDQASASFILLFCCRQIITFSLALLMQGFLIDFLALGTRIMLRLLGPIITLCVVQSKGWPMIFFWWGIFDFAFLYGESSTAQHWGHGLEIRLFNESNPSGNIVNNDWYRSVLAIAVSVSVVVAFKRFFVGLYLGRKTFSHFGQNLAEVMEKMLLVSGVAELAKGIERSTIDSTKRLPAYLTHHESFRKVVGTQSEDEDSERTSLVMASEPVFDTTNRDPLTGSLHHSERLKLMQLLENWEEPVRRDTRAKNESASISAVLRFRKALTFIQKQYPFSKAFGPAQTREQCIESCQSVYMRLLKHTPKEDVLSFDTLALVALDPAGRVDQETAKAMVKLFRPDRSGKLTMLDFIKSVDSVYKEFRMLDASIENSSQIDRAFENMFNVAFYVVVVTFTMSQLGFDPLALFLSLSSIILAFAFMIGSASSKYFEGVLFILARRPYGIGDLIQIDNTESDTSLDGVLPWVVENVTLFETELTHLPTNERASLSNGALASSRIINWARSPQARFHIFLNFPIDTPYEKIVLFKKAVEEYMKARPREWRSLDGFRANRVVSDRGFLEFIIVIQHREAWQQVGTVLDSKANLSSYCLEVMKQLNMNYRAPPLPVDLKYAKASPDLYGDRRGENEDLNVDALTEAFRSSALNKHNIRI